MIWKRSISWIKRTFATARQRTRQKRSAKIAQNRQEKIQEKSEDDDEEIKKKHWVKLLNGSKLNKECGQQEELDIFQYISQFFKSIF